MRREVPRCRARTRGGTACFRKALRNGRCPNHGGLSTGPKTPEGRQRIAAAQVVRWPRRMSEKKSAPLGGSEDALS
jgi:hypothetical protein